MKIRKKEIKITKETNNTKKKKYAKTNLRETEKRWDKWINKQIKEKYQKWRLFQGRQAWKFLMMGLESDQRELNDRKTGLAQKNKRKSKEKKNSL